MLNQLQVFEDVWLTSQDNERRPPAGSADLAPEGCTAGRQVHRYLGAVPSAHELQAPRLNDQQSPQCLPQETQSVAVNKAGVPGQQ